MTAEIHASVVTIDKSATSKAGVVDRSAGIKTVVTPGQGNPARISAKGGATIELLQADSKWAPEIVKVRRVGSDLQVDFLEDSSGSSDLVIEGFYEQEGAKLVGYGKDGEVYDYVAQSDSFDQSLPFLMDGGEPVIQVLAEPATAFGVVGGFAALPMWLAGGAVLSTAAIAAQDPGSPAPVPAPAPAPHKPIAPTSYNDNAAPVINARSAAAATNDTTPGLNIGTGLLNPKLYVNGKEVAATYDPKTGTLTPDTPLAEGAYSLTYTHANSDGVYSEQSAPLMLTVDVTAPAKPAPATGYNDNVGAVQNASSTAATTDDNTPGLNIGSGHTQPKLYVDGVLVAATYDAATGTLTPGIALSDGAHQLTYTVSDAAGNESAQSDPTSITVITTGVSKPSAPSSYDDNAAPVLNTQSTAFATNDATPGLNVGRDLIDPRLYVDGLEVPAIYNPLTGTLTPTAPLPEGNHRLTFTQSNDSGGVSEQSDALVLLVDTVPPATPLAAPAGYKDDVGLVQSANSTAPTTDDNKPGVLVGVNLSDTPKLYVDGVQVAASYDPITGTLTPLSALADGARSLSYTLTDAAGNESGNSPALSLTIMGGGPQPGSEGTLSLTDDVGAIQGLIALGGVTDDTRPTFSGIGAGPDVVKVNVYDANTLLGTANLNSNGEWSYELTTPLAIGDHSLTARPVNAAGVEGQAGKAWTFKVQGDAPTMPVIAGVSDNLGGVTGNIAKGAPTDDPTPTVNGTGTAGSTIKLYADGVEVGSTTVAADGSWTVTSTALTGDGTKLLTAKAFDSAGQASPETSAYAILLDTTAPAKPSPIVATDDQGTVLGTVANGGTTDDTTPMLSGAGAPGDLISVYDGSSLLGRVMVQANGTWSFALAQPLSAGAHAITATATDPAGNTSAPSDPLNLVVDFSAPQPGSEGTLTLLDDVGAIKGEVARGSVTDDARPTFKGSGASADVAKVNVYDGAVLLGSATVTNGSWSFEPTTPLASGDHNLTARPVDAAGNEGPASNGWNFKLLGDAPAAPAITGVSDNAGSVTGSIAKGATTDDTTPTVSGTGTAGTTVKLYADGVEVGSTTVAADGTWSVASSALVGDGTKQLTAKAIDGAGQSSPETGAYAIVLDTTAPAKPGLAVATDDQGAVQGPVVNGGTTDDAYPTLSGSGTPGDTVKVYDNGAILLGTAQVQANGSWNFTPTTPLGGGAHAITTTTTDAAGNTSAASDPLNITVDTSNVSVSVGKATDNAGSKQGDLANGASTDDTTPTLVGTAAANATITVKEGATTLGTATADASGAWSFTLPQQAQGLHSYTVEARNAAGTVGTTTFGLTVDTTPSAVPAIGGVTDDVGTVQGPVANGASTDDTTPTLSGTGGTAGDTVKVYDNGVLLGSALVQANGGWSFTPTTPLTDGSHPLTVTSTDAQGNESAPSAAYTVRVDTAAPATPTAAPAGYKDDVGAVQSASSTAPATDDTRPGILVGANLTDTPKLYVDGVAVAAAYDPVAGTLTPNSPLPEGAHNISYTLTDAAGNESGKSPALNISVDTGAPAPGSEGTLTLLDDVGAIKGEVARGSVTDDARPTFKGSGASADVAKVNVYDGAVLLGSATVTNGSWSFEPTTPLASGDHNLTARPVDAAGNEGPASNGWNFKLLGDAPAAPAITGVSDNAGSVTGSIAKGATTDDTTPTVSGTGTAGTTVKLYADGVEVGSTTVAADGTWSVASSALIGDGTKQLTAKAIDGAGQSSPETGAYAIVLDTTAPAKQGLAVATDDQGAVQGPVVNGGTTDDSTPALSGSGTPGDTIKVYDNGTLLGSAAVQANGSWSFTPTTQLTSGAHAITTTTTDAAGNTSAASDPLNFTVDTSNVNVSVGKAIDNAGSKQGDLANGASTDDTTPTLVGTAAAGATITIKEGSSTLGTATADSSGAWSFTLPQQAQGLHDYIVEARNAAGTTGTTTFGLTIDTMPPAMPSISGVTDDVGTVQGAVANNASTDDTTPTLTGTAATAGDTIKVYDNGALLGSTTVQSNGTWSFTPTAPLTEGSHPLTVTSTDPQGNESTPSAAYTVKVDTTAPTAPLGAPAGYKDDVGAVQSASSTAPATDDTRPGILVGANLTDTPKLYVDGVAVAAAYDPVAGTLTPNSPLPEGAHNISYTLTDAPGNESGKSPALNISVDTGAPVPGSEGTLTLLDDVGAIKGEVARGSVTDDARPTFKGSGASADVAKVNVYDGAVLLGSATVTNGSWSFEPTTPLASGDHNLTARPVDAAGNEGPASSGWNFKLLTDAPAQPAITGVSDNAGSVTGSIAKGATTDDTTPTVSGTGTAGTTVKLYADGVEVGSTTVAADGTWSVASSALVGDGTKLLTAKAIDGAGQSSAETGAYPIVLDTTAPVKPSLAVATDDQGAVQGPVANGGTTDDATPTLGGTGTPGDTVKVYDNGTLLGSAAVQTNGAWSFTPTTPLGGGAHAITTTTTDAAGNTSAASDPLNITVDTSNVSVSVGKAIDNAGSKQGDLANGASTDDTTPTLVGTAAANATITVKEGATTLGTATADASGAWSFTLPLQAQGPHNYTVEARNAAGTVGTTTFGLTVDTTPSAVPAIGGVTDDVGTVQGPVANGASTDDTTPTLSGTGGTAGDTVKVYDNGVLLGSALVQANGGWSFTPTTPLTDGSHPLTVTSTDAQGNESAPSAAYTVRVDTAAPATPTAAPAGYKDDVGAVQSASSTAPATDDTRPGILVGANLTDTPKLYVDGVAVAAAYDPVAGTLTPNSPLPEGAHNISYTLTDAAGNESGKSPALNISVDTGAPAPGSEGTLTLLDDVGAIKGEVARGSVTDDARPTFKGSGASADVAKVNVYDGAVLLGSATVTNGSWSFEPTTPLASGDHNLTARPVDAAGNEGPASNGWNFKLLGDAPAAPAITGVSDNAGSVTGSIAKGATTDDTTPTVSGTGTAGTTVKLYADGVEVGSTTVAADGTWSVASSALIGDGTKQLTAKAIDGAGQSSPETGAYAIVLDTTAPAKQGLAVATDDQGAVQGPVVNGGTTDDSTPALSGSGTPGDTIKVYDNGTLLGSAAVQANGSWSFTPTTQLTSGAHAITTTTTDAAGNTSAASDPLNFTVDTSNVNVSVGKAIDNAGSKQGDLANGASTDDTTPTLVGTAAAGATITIKEGSSTLGTATADSSGAWSFTLPQQAQGLHDYIVEARNAAGTTGTTTFGLTIDTMPPAMPSISGVTDDVGTVQGAVANNASTDDTTPTLTGTAATAGDTIKVYDNGALLGSTTVQSNGTWSFTPTAPLTEGSHPLTVTSTDPQGNESTPSAAYTVKVDTTAPTAPLGAPAGYKDDVGAVQSASSTAPATDDTRPGILVGANLTDTPKLYVDGVAVAAAYDPVAGTLTPNSPLPEGAHNISYTLTDAPGNESGKSPALNISVDTGAPVPGSEGTLTLLDDVGAIKGEVARGSVTDDARPTFKGSGASADVAKVNVYDGAVLLGSATVTNGSWSFEPTTPLASGDHNLTARPVDAAGNEGPASSGWNFKLLTDAPAQPAITGVSDNAGSVTGSIAKGATTDDTTPTVSGTGTAGTTVKLYADGVEVGSTTVAADGTWSVASSALVGDGTKLLTAKAIDGAGQSSAETGAYPIVLDTTAPVKPSLAVATDDQGAVQGPVANGGTTDDATPTLGGTGTPGDTVKVYDNGTLLGSAAVQTNGAWSFTPTTPLGGGAHAITTTTTDAAGNTSAASDPLNITVDTSNVSVSVGKAIDNAGSKQGDLANGASTDDTTPTLVGTAAANATITVKEGATTLGTATADASGAWSFTLPLQAQGPHNYTVEARNAAGTVGTTTFGLTVDTTPSAVPAIGGVTDDVGTVQGPVANGASTDDTTPTLSGTGGTAGDTVKVYDNGVLLGSALVQANGGWSFTPTTPLTDGSHPLTVTSTDAQGNESAPSAAYTVRVDTAAPATPTAAPAGYKDDVGAVQSASSTAPATDDTRPGILVGANLTDTPKLYVDGVAVAAAYDPVAGTLTPNSPLPEGAHNISYTLTDAAGNESGKSPALNISVDTMAPLAGPAPSSYDDNTGPVINANSTAPVTNDTTPGVYVGMGLQDPRLYVNGTAVAATYNASTGALTPNVPLGDGTYNITYTSANSAGVESLQSAPLVLKVDTLAPAAPTIALDQDTSGTQTGTAGDAYTKDGSYTASGLEQGATLQYSLDGTNWSAGKPTAVEGTNTISVRQIDAAGNVSGSSSLSFTLDTATPAPSQTTMQNVFVGSTPSFVLSGQQVNTSTAGNQSGPVTVATGNGGYFIAWYDNDAFVDPAGPVRGQYFAADGAKVGAELTFGGPNWRVNGDSWADMPMLSAVSLGNGKVALSWQTENGNNGVGGSGSNATSEVAYATATLNGTTASAGTPALANTTLAANQSGPTMVATKDGGFFVAWYNADFSDPQGVVRGQFFDANGNKSGGELQLGNWQVNGDSFSVGQPPLSAVTLGNGSIAVAWIADNGASGPGTGSTEVAQVVVSSTGVVGNQSLVNTSTAGNQGAPVMVATSDGGYFVAWFNADDSNAGGQGRISGQYFDANGSKVGGNLSLGTWVVNEDAGVDMPYLTATALKGGKVVVGWETENNIDFGGPTSTCEAAMLVVSNNGGNVTVGSQSIINTTTAGQQSPPVIAALDTGGFFATWYDDVFSNPANAVVRGQYFDAQGQKLGSEILVGSYRAELSDAGEQPPLSVTALTGGKVVVSWNTEFDDNRDGSGTAVFQSIVNMPAATVAEGTAEASSTVTLTNSAGTVLGSTVSDAQGHWKITTTEAQDTTRPLYVSVVDKAGNTVTKPLDFTPPVVLDLNRDGHLDYSHVVMDVTGDGVAERTTWAGAGDGVLVWDKHGDAVVHDSSQYAFTQYGGSTDLQGLAAGFDSNQDGIFDASDKLFSQFAVWRDANQNGASDAGEVRSLSEWGITSLSLTSDGHTVQGDGVVEFGRTTATLADGSTMLAADAMFAHDTLEALVRNAGGTQRADLSQDTSANVLDVKLSDVQANAQKLLVVTADSNDVVRLDDANWTNTGATATVDNHTYAVWSNAGAHLLVDNNATLHQVI